MKKLLIVSLSLFFLAGCSSGPKVGGDASGTAHRRPGIPVLKADELKPAKKPGIPTAKKTPKTPKIPTGNLIADISAPAKDVKPEEKPASKEMDMDTLFDTIVYNIDRPTITDEDIQRGWYYGSKSEKKFGTPQAWMWFEDGDKSRWVSENSKEATKLIGLQELCVATGGTYVVSCMDSTAKDCKYIAESKCDCAKGSGWHTQQGCLLKGKDGKFVAITTGEIRQGYYKGEKTRKKFNTPASWVWKPGADNPRWQNPPGN